MNILLIGCGGMGRAVQRVALERGHEVHVVDPHYEGALAREFSGEVFEKLSPDTTLVIDCSLGEFVIDHLKVCAEVGANLITVATGWYERLSEVKEVVADSEIGFLWSSNFSIGVNLYFKIVEAAAKMVDNFEEYDVWGHEIHHFNKADSPSGTAKTLEKILLKNIERKTAVVEEKLDRRREDNEIHFSSVRGGAVNFEHVIGFDSAADTIKISHAARSRNGYALGAVKAAEWLDGKKGYFEMEDFLADSLSIRNNS